MSPPRGSSRIARCRRELLLISSRSYRLSRSQRWSRKVYRLSGKQIRFAILMILIVAGSCLRVFVCFQHNPLDYLLADPGRHWMNGLRFPKGAYFGASDPIGYQIYIFALRKLTADNRLLVALAAALLSVAMPWTYYRAARDFGLAKTSALWVWMLIVWTPSLLTIYHYIMMETLLLLLEGVALWMTARYLRKGEGGAFLLFVASWTLASLTKPSVAPLAAICFLWVWWKKSTPLRQIAGGAALALVLLMPQAIRSYAALGFVAPFGNPWLIKIQHRSGAKTVHLDFYTHADRLVPFVAVPRYDMEFSSPSAYVQPLEPFSGWMMQRSAGNSLLILAVDSAHGERDWKRAYAGLHVGWPEWFRQWRENIVLFFFAPSWPESTASDWDGRLEYEGRWMWAPLILFVLVIDFRRFLHRRFDLITVATTLFTLFLALQNIVTAEGRYRKPLEPLLLLNAVWVIAKREPATDPVAALVYTDSEAAV